MKEQHLTRARTLFNELSVEVVTASRFLGGCIGNEIEVQLFVQDRVKQWVDHVKCLAHAAPSYPQSAYAAFTHSLSFEWPFLQRVVGGLEDEYMPLRDVIHTVLAPAILGHEVLQNEHDLLSLPAKFGRLVLSDPVHSASIAYETSKKGD